jgi:hypothetical protein
MTKPKWDNRIESRAWGKDEAWPRFVLRPEKIEMVEGKLLSTEQDRETLLALLLENIARIAPYSSATPGSGARLSPS